MDIASEKGYPVIRPMFFEYPDDEICYTLDSQYMFGSDIIFAPIVNRGQTVKTVYIPDGEWVLTKDKNFGDKIDAILKQKGMTQKEFARKMGKTEAEVSRWVGGTHNFTLRTIAKISDVLGERILTI